MQWSYTETDVSAGDGQPQVSVSAVMPLEGTPYERVLQKDGKPLPEDEERREQRKYEEEYRKRQSESPEQRRARIEKFDKDRAFVAEIPEAYDFRIVGEESVCNRPAWVLSLTPKSGYVPVNSRASMLKHIEGKLWIDKQDVQWAKAEAHVIDVISIGFILARIGPGARITMLTTRVAPGLWMPTEITINGTARVLLVHNKNLDERITFSGYHQGPAKPADTQVAVR